MCKLYGSLKTYIGLAGDVLAIVLLVVVISTYLQKEGPPLIADGEGYYEYLPALFIYHDLSENKIKTETPRGNRELYLVKCGEKYVNKYTCGTAILMSPFFLIAHLQAEDAAANGYSAVYQHSISYAAIFYVFLFAFFFRKLLETYSVKPAIIFSCQLLAILATPVLRYANEEASFSHVYSLFAITAFLYFSRLYIRDGKAKQLYIAALLFGLIFLLRQANIVAILLVPFLADSSFVFLQRIKLLFRNYRVLVAALAIFLVVVSVQLVLWYVQTGQWFVYSYGDEKFIFTEPHMFDFLFSYKRGMFLYAPVLLVCIGGIVYWIMKRNFWSLFTWFVPLTIIVYIFSSWHVWCYGASFGCRPMIEFVPLFILPFALFVNRVRNYVAALCIFISAASIPLCMIQNWQYSKYILHWGLMDEKKYWDVFLETEPHFVGFLWKRQYYLDHRLNYTPLDSARIGNHEIFPWTEVVVWTDTIEDWSALAKANMLQMEFDGTFKREMNSFIVLRIFESGNNTPYVESGQRALHFAEAGLDIYHRGIYNYEFPAKELRSPVIVTIEVKAHEGHVIMDNARVRWVWYHPQ